MFDNTATLESLPTIEPDTFPYRGHRFDAGLFRHAYVSSLEEGETLEHLQERGLYTTAYALSIWNEAHNANRVFDAHVEALAINAAVSDLNLTLTITPTAEPTLEDLERDLSSGAVPDAKLAKLRALVERVKAAEAKATRLESEQITDPKDPRMTTVLGRAASVADEEGYCSVYDNISNRVGFPDRDELREMGALEMPTWLVTGYVYVDYTVRVRHGVTFHVEAPDQNDAYEAARDFFDDEDVDDYLVTSYDAPDSYEEREIDEDSFEVYSADRIRN